MKNFRRWKLALQEQKLWNVSGQTDLGNGEKHLFFEKKFLSWQNILNSWQIATDIEEKLANQGEVRGGISRILPFLIKQMETTPRSHEQSAK